MDLHAHRTQPRIDETGMVGPRPPGPSPRLAAFVLAGGIGARLWPLSRVDKPKQFHGLASASSMLERTIARLRTAADATPVYVIASARHECRTTPLLAGIDLCGGLPIFEPMGRNTAAAVAIATLETLSTQGDDLVLVLPADHEVSPAAHFWQALRDGVPAATAGKIVVFGISPTRPETGYGYIEARANGSPADAAAVVRFREKPDQETARAFLETGGFFWNAGIFLFRAGVMRDVFLDLRPDIWEHAQAAFAGASRGPCGVHLPREPYARIPSISIDKAIMEHTADVAMVPARFRWSDIGSWQSLLETGEPDESGNVVFGDVTATDCRNAYLRSDGHLLSVVGVHDLAVVATPDATLVAPLSQSQNIGAVVEGLQRQGRLEARFTPQAGCTPPPGAWRDRIRHWLCREALPLWLSAGVDTRHGGFFEALSLKGAPLPKPKRIRTMARQIYAFAVAAEHGWHEKAYQAVSEGIDFLVAHARGPSGGWVRTLNRDGSVADAVEDAYDHACILLALALAHRCGEPRALALAEETLAFLEGCLRPPRHGGFMETSGGGLPRRSNPHMHMLEAFVAWYDATGDQTYLRRAGEIVDLFLRHFFDAETWTLGEFFDEGWRPAADTGTWTEPGHHFEWTVLLLAYSARAGRTDLLPFARRLHAFAVANGLNRATGLAHGAVSRSGVPLDTVSRSWPQTEATRAAIALHRSGAQDLRAEIEARLALLFRWHLNSAAPGLWIDRIGADGTPCATEVPASILYHLTSAFADYLDYAASGVCAE